MKMRLITTTAIGLALTSAAFAQTPSQQPTDKSPPASAQTQQNAPQQNAPQQNNAQPQGGQAANPAPSGTGQAAGTNPPASSTTSQAPASGTAPSQAQTAPTSQPSSQQSANPPPANTSQAQQAPATGNTAQQPNTTGDTAQQQQPANTGTTQQPATAQSSQGNVNAQVNINDQQRTRISQSVAKLDVKPLTNVNFQVSVGTVVPRDVHLSTLPADVVEIVPQYRGFSFFVVKDEIVIVDPQSYKIVTTLPYSGSTAAAAPAKERSKTSFSDRDRDVIRKHSRSAAKAAPRAEGRTTGSATRTEIRVGDQLPESVEIEAFPEMVHRDAPTLREYRYLNRENRTYIIEPRERRVIEEID